MKKIRILLFGIGVFGALCILMFQFSNWRKNIETDLTHRSLEALNNARLNWVKVDFNERGRDMYLSGYAPTLEAKNQAEKIAKKVIGVRIIESHIVVRSLSVNKKTNNQSSFNIKKKQSQQLRFKLKRCQNRFNIALRHRDIEFMNQKILPSSEPVLKQLLSAVLSCPNIQVEVIGHAYNQSTALLNKQLSGSYSLAVANYLVNHGVPVRRLVAVGAGEKKLQVKDAFKQNSKTVLIEFLAVP